MSTPHPPPPPVDPLRPPPWPVPPFVGRVAMGAPWTLDQAAAGDLLFLTAPGDALGGLIKDLDRSDFSHVGVLREGPAGRLELVSARTHAQGWSRADVGGIRAEAVHPLMARRPHVARLVPALRSRAPAALAWIDQWTEGPRLSRDLVGPLRAEARHRSRFSFAKLFLVCAALDAHDAPGREPMWHAALDAAPLWSWSSRIPPGFFCSEVVGTAYGLDFPTSDFPPPSGTFAAARFVAPSRRGLTSRLVDLALSLRAGVPSSPQALAYARLLQAVATHDPGLFGKAASAAWQLVLPAFRRKRAVTRAAATAVEPPRLPGALVTPRMVLSDAVVESLHPLVV